MSERIFHLQRTLLSYSYQALLYVISACLSLPTKHGMIIVFSLFTIGCGIAFTLEPQFMANYFELYNLSIIALSDIRAYYGTMLIALGAALIVLASQPTLARASYLMIAAFCLGSAAGRLLGFFIHTPIISIHGLLFLFEIPSGGFFIWQWNRLSHASTQSASIPPLSPKTPEQFQPLSKQNFVNPYAYYRMLRDQYPVYKMPGHDYFLLSRYEDVTHACLHPELYSSKLMEILVRGKPKPLTQTKPSIVERLGLLGIVPVDVLALQDPPIHSQERKATHSGLNANFVKSLDSEIESLCTEMMDEFIPKGSIEFIQDFAWKLPMRLIIRLLGFPESDFEIIKAWCVDGIESLSGTASKATLIRIGASNAGFMRYLWKHYLLAKKNPKNNLTGMLISLANNPDSAINDQQAVSIILQLLIAGSDSSASSMGNAIRILAENPSIEQELRQDPDLIPLFIEEVFRFESAFQGHFRITTQDIMLHDTLIPAQSRVFLLWASANRDERFWDKPDIFNLHRNNVKKHLTFGHGIHACIGRELARMEIRIVIRQLLTRTTRFAIMGETPYLASLFARTLLSLPLAFETAESSDTHTHHENTPTETLT